jgi:chain length determinant protein (polysaccharide antigen chain regulator)
VNQRTSDQSPVIDAGFHDDEIDLFDLWDDLVANKIWVGLGLFACIVLAVVYLAMAKPVYEVKSVIKPASERDLVEINVPQLKGIYSLGVDAAFEHAKRAMLSKEYHRNFYQQNLLKLKALDGLYNPLLTESQNFTRFDDLLSVQLSNDKKDDEKYIELKFQWADAEVAADLLNAYVGFALQGRLIEVEQTIESKRFVRINKLEYDASLIRDKYYSQKLQRKLKLDEALGIAKSVGQLEPIYSKSDILGSFKPPLYMYGAKALAAEEIALNQRESLAKNLPHGEEHFIEGLSSILFEIKQLKDLRVDYSKVEIAQLDEPALVPIRPIKPRKLLVVALSVVAGGFLGIMLALIMAAYKRHVKRT